jgi:hypothetical protein
MPASHRPFTEWHKSSFSQNGDCVEISFSDREVLVRHSKHPEDAVLTFNSSEWAAFIAGARTGEFDQP